MFKSWSGLVIVFALLFSSWGCATQSGSPSPAAKQDAAATKQEKQDSAPAKQEAGKLEKVKVGYAAQSVGFVPAWIAKDAKLYEKYGLDAELSYIAGGPVLVASLLSGEVQFGQMAAPSPMNSYLQGGETIWIATPVNTAVLYMAVLPSISKMEDLKGKTVGVTKIGSTTDAFTKFALRKYGLEPNKDVPIFQTGGGPETLAAFQSGNIYGALLGPTELFAAQKTGAKNLLDITSLGIDYPMSGVAVTKKFINSNPDTIRKFMKAYVEAISLVTADPKLTKAAISKYTNTADQSEVDQMYDAYLKHFDKAPYPTVKAMQNALSDMAETDPKAKSADPKEFFDDHFVKELDDSGFIKKLYEK